MPKKRQRRGMSSLSLSGEYSDAWVSIDSSTECIPPTPSQPLSPCQVMISDGLFSQIGDTGELLEIGAWKVKCHLPANQITSVGAIRPFRKDTSSEELTEALIDAGFRGVTVERIYKGKDKIVTAFFKVVFNTTTLPQFVRIGYQQYRDIEVSGNEAADSTAKAAHLLRYRTLTPYSKEETRLLCVEVLRAKYKLNMTNDIKQVSQLPPETVYRIKSSQVITSVYAALKELVENALDSGASVLNVRLEDYGLKLIEVKDNGHGISESDLSKVCLPHTTSKIVQFSDLENLSTYGFRGEALSSLCQLASVTITSKPLSCSVGRSCCFSATGNITASKSTACNTGTCVTVSKLFQPLPVRLKFHSDGRRKKEQLKKVEELLMAYSVARPGLHVTLTHDRQVVYHKSAAANTHQCLHAVFKECAPSLVNVCRTRDKLTISVFLPRLSKGDLENISSSKEASLKSKKKASTLPLYCRPTPDKLFILVNDRPVYHKELEKRVKLFFSSCHEKLERSCPMGVIIVQLPADTIDVNLEPSKDRVIISGEDVVLELLTEILTELYGPVNEALPRSLLEKQALQENTDHEFMNKENINSSPENSSPRSTDTTSSNFSASCVDGSFCNQTSASTNLGVRSSKITKQPAFSENVPGDLLPASNLTPDERNVLEEILSQDILAHDPGASNLVPASAPSLSEVPGSSFSNPVFLNEPILCYQAQEGENISSLDKNEVLRRSSILALPIGTTSAADEGSHDTEPPSALLRGVSGDINPVAWSKGQILGDSGTNIQSVHVLSADPRGCRRGLSDDCSVSPAKRFKISFDDFRSSCIESKPLHSPSGCLEPLKNEDLITVSNSEVPTPIANSTSVIPSTNSSNAPHQIPSVQITSPDNITPVKSVKHSSNSTSDFCESSESIHMRNGTSRDPLVAGENSTTFKSSRLDVSVSSANGSSLNNDDTSSPQLRGSEALLHSEVPPRRLETSADRAACRTVLGTPTTERWPHGGHLVCKPITAFAAFAKHVRSDVLRELAGADFTVVGKEIAVRWKALDPEARHEFEEVAKRDVVRYHKEIRELRQRQRVSQMTASPGGSMDRFVSPVAWSSLDGSDNDGANANRSPTGVTGNATSDKNNTPGTANNVKKSSHTDLKPWQSRCITTDVSLSHIKSLLLAGSRRSSAPTTLRMVGRLHYPSLPSLKRGGGTCTKEDAIVLGNSDESNPCGAGLTCSRNDARINSPATQIDSHCTMRDPCGVFQTAARPQSPRNSATSLSGTPADTPTPADSPVSDCGQNQTTSSNTLCWVCVDPQTQTLYGVHSSALCELLLCYQLLESYKLPAQPLANPVPFNESTLVNWHALLHLPRRPSLGTDHDIVTDPRLSSNGLEVVLYRDGSVVTHGELVAVADNVGFYGINDLQEVLSYIARNPAATLIQTRPVKLRHWIQAESVRMTRCSDERDDDYESVTEKLQRWRNFSFKYSPSPAAAGVTSGNVPSFLSSANVQSNKDVPLPVPGLPNPGLCLHNKAILHVLYNLDDLPGSQSQQHRSSQ
ncbi:DNA mismatch repair protein C-terminal [Trinorchestia longiramus]|nr:DNA mismatch repair protein C-terminal [Trinorchestia longiramus]